MVMRGESLAELRLERAEGFLFLSNENSFSKNFSFSKLKSLFPKFFERWREKSFERPPMSHPNISRLKSGFSRIFFEREQLPMMVTAVDSHIFVKRPKMMLTP